MVKFIIGRQLVGKKVITTDGFDLGEFVDADFSPVTGKINAILVEPDPESSVATKMDTDDDGKIKVPYAAVHSVNDYIMVDRREM
ncbi:PRC-barrel domain-containing protein [Candidatus Mancarchaeum acidiphilum]|uniref:PRC-barrel domain-containing protein n=1 Tax=Candidatus Mancarchaeum acidiphilum TaxID=1920749 RepID=A0A218NP29_9ARCH|nr:PRC-barrel domain-containing protein [Candidatus Mancarchaeum acidiphilum]ASI14215.1 PRC-barrel domain-containing protein [Candidatus Mancarchaeum acidiphilum]